MYIKTALIKFKFCQKDSSLLKKREEQYRSTEKKSDEIKTVTSEAFTDYDSTSRDEYQEEPDLQLMAADIKEYEQSDFAGWTDEELRLAINEIYARHGRKFKNQEIQEYFNKQTCYTPQYSPEEFDSKSDTILNSVEKHNIKVMSDLRKNNCSTTIYDKKLC